MYILISGKQGVGKTTTASMLQKFLGEKRMPVWCYKFAEPLYLLHQLIYSALDQYGIKPPPEKKIDGPLLQVLGTEWGRNTKDKDIWVKAAKHRIGMVTEAWKQNTAVYAVLIDDCRFENEFDAFCKESLTVRLECPRDLRKVRAEKWRENESHESEIGLDAYVAAGKFDIVIDTSKLTVQEVVEKIYETLKQKIDGAFNK